MGLRSFDLIALREISRLYLQDRQFGEPCLIALASAFGGNNFQMKTTPILLSSRQMILHVLAGWAYIDKLNSAGMANVPWTSKQAPASEALRTPPFNLIHPLRGKRTRAQSSALRRRWPARFNCSLTIETDAPPSSRN